MPKQSDFGRISYQSATLNADLMIDPVLPYVGRYLSVGFILGVGVGVVAQGISTNSFFGMMANTGVAFNFFGHNRVELEFKLLANKDISWWGDCACRVSICLLSPLFYASVRCVYWVLDPPSKKSNSRFTCSKGNSTKPNKPS
ncbi:hypothetical protein ASB7_10160 [Helicobacter ailurogastricus]|nr:hypothetical protein ASB7_10160 [Helicobacter ailurogastricus]